MDPLCVFTLCFIGGVILTWLFIWIFLPKPKDCISAHEFIEIEKRALEKSDQKHKALTQKVNELKRDNRK